MQIYTEHNNRERHEAESTSIHTRPGILHILHVYLSIESVQLGHLLPQKLTYNGRPYDKIWEDVRAFEPVS